jgi:hypothetical protein
MEKIVIVPERLRKVPTGNFSWVDQRIVREGYIQKLSLEAATLYLFLVIVADRNGLSYYSDEGVLKCLQLSAETLRAARQRLVELTLVAYRKPLYQVLSLQACVAPAAPPQARTPSQPVAVGTLLRNLMERKAS